MLCVYNLALQENSAKQWEKFDIGMFSTRELAEKTAERYLKEVKGFNNGNYSSVIKEMEVICNDGKIPNGKLFVIYGCNKDENGDVCNAVVSDCYSEDMDFYAECNGMQRVFGYSFWDINEYILDECRLNEGI